MTSSPGRAFRFKLLGPPWGRCGSLYILTTDLRGGDSKPVLQCGRGPAGRRSWSRSRGRRWTGLWPRGVVRRANRWDLGRDGL